MPANPLEPGPTPTLWADPIRSTLYPGLPFSPKKFLTQEAKLGAEERKARLDYFHRDVHKTAISVTCNQCHAQKNAILDFRDLGYSEKEAKDLIYLNIKGLVTKYKVFYFPDLFRQ